LFLGVECGGTHSVALVADGEGRVLTRRELGPGNLHLLSDRALRRHLRALAEVAPRAAAVGLGFSGARTPEDRARVHREAARLWPDTPIWVGNDLETALAAADPDPAVAATVLIISGTGACCFGRNRAGRAVRVGGWGHVLGDQGSGYAIARAALQAVVETLDRAGRWPPLGARLLRALALNHPEELVDWSLQADKQALAAVAPEVFAAAADGDRAARRLLREAAERLAEDALACARRLARPGASVRFMLTGSCLTRDRGLAAPLRRALRRERPGARVEPLAAEGALGAIREAIAAWRRSATGPAKTSPSPAGAPEPSEPLLPEATALSPTEARHPASLNLDRMPLREAVRLFIEEEETVTEALRACRRPLERTVRLVAAALKAGGRLIYAGAGTSGRLGVLDASECPPTFRASPEQVQGIIAGGRRALWTSVEGAEDSFEAGRQAALGRGVNRRDVLFGIAASGRTPFVWGALAAAREAGARTVLLTFNPRLRFPAALRPDVVICPETGPELLTGSTRLKAGTATKRVLNLVTTLGMVRLGKVRSNLMVDVNPANRKLRDRAVRMVRELTGVEAETARAALVRHGWVVKRALAALTRSRTSGVKKRPASP
jgi:N-acetylmuramic acid 6-phosphate etherase